MTMDLRKAILANIKNNTIDELEATIVDAISTGEEKLLPGLGYLFEIIWQESSTEEKDQQLQALFHGLKREA